MEQTGASSCARDIRRVLRRSQFLGRVGLLPRFAPEIEDRLSVARAEYRRQRQQELDAGAPLKVAVSGWSLSQNAAGRVMTLVDAYSRTTPDVEIIGWLVTRWGRELWEPIRDMDVRCRTITLFRGWGFVAKAFRFVAEHPYDVVHLSKPRLHNVLLGHLYELVWGTRVIMDVDDEELGFSGGGEALSAPAARELGGGRLPRPKVPHDAFWTRVAVGQVSAFAQVTVSNPALQQRYGGELLPHVRDEEKFVPSQQRRQSARRRWGIPENVKTVLFFGTPRRHKGLVETAQAIAQASSDNVWFVVAGAFPPEEESLKEELNAVQGVNCRFIGAQSYASIPDVVALGDCVILLQEAESVVAQYQLPAKMMDALAMGLTVLGTPTPATQWLVDAGVLIPVTAATVTEKLRAHLDETTEQSARAREFFLNHLSVGAAQRVLRRLLSEPRGVLPDWRGQLCTVTSGRLDSLLAPSGDTELPYRR